MSARCKACGCEISELVEICGYCVSRESSFAAPSAASRRYFQVTSSVGSVTRNVKCSDVQQLLGLIDYEIGVGALNISISVEQEKQH